MNLEKIIAKSSLKLSKEIDKLKKMFKGGLKWIKIMRLATEIEFAKGLQLGILKV